MRRLMMRFFQVSSISCLALGCGDGDDRAKPGPVASFTGNIFADEDLVVDSVAELLDEVTGSIADQSETSVSTLIAEGAKFKSRKCTAQESGSVLVEVERSFEQQSNRKGKRFSGSREVVSTGTLARTWSKEGTTLACNTNNTHLKLPRADRADASLSVVFERTKSMKVNSEGVKRTIVKSKESKAEGTRTIAFDSVSADGEDVVISKSISKKVERSGSLELKRTNNQTGEIEKDISTSFATTIEVAADKPLKVEVTRDKTTGEWLSRRIVSGTTTSTLADGSVVSLVFSDVLYTVKKLCQAESGTIAGEVKVKGDSGELETKFTFAITFDGEASTLTFAGDDTPNEVEMDACDLVK